ncbi:MAG: hypothetical protein JGK27_29645 [Microcoleus sp. PH2017_20_SFW_D_A]|jgi:hypothetical protein|uniref:hypothetical protein n=1 Tax=unclassified Microcoleus TaxID=2642155 RepID=UPI001D222635|nr:MULTISPECIES: hypothetical protein [unclassified Microcoleus]MCC3506840.1 hypothetical protein [Microcoleus sp. PH2017_19_SFW_U_A]MCC3525755.1 hypothetical protein [Microcoleus sp. PH2017_20_SFW_D_A]
MNSLILISPYKGSGFQPILSGKCWFGFSLTNESSFSIVLQVAQQKRRLYGVDGIRRS